jgi:hypothetical protein
MDDVASCVDPKAERSGRAINSFSPSENEVIASLADIAGAFPAPRIARGRDFLRKHFSPKFQHRDHQADESDERARHLETGQSFGLCHAILL